MPRRALRRLLSVTLPPPRHADWQPCPDLRGAPADLPALSEGCEQCVRLGQRWTHLRLCLVCGHVGCCDSDPFRHATTHWEQTGHAVMRSYQPGETWRWCYRHEQLG